MSNLYVHHATCPLCCMCHRAHATHPLFVACPLRVSFNCCMCHCAHTTHPVHSPLSVTLGLPTCHGSPLAYSPWLSACLLSVVLCSYFPSVTGAFLAPIVRVAPMVRAIRVLRATAHMRPTLFPLSTCVRVNVRVNQHLFSFVITNLSYSSLCFLHSNILCVDILNVSVYFFLT